MYKLVIQDDEGKTTVVPLIRDELTIGRKEGNTIRLTERNVSRRHARLIRQNGSITIEDLNSYNGIRVNGSRIQGRCQIRETDRVQIGDYLIELKSEAAHEKGDTISERTMPIERIDPHATTPVPDTVEPGDSSVATTRMSKAESVPSASFSAAVTEPMAPLPDTEPGAGPVAAAPMMPVAPVPHAVPHARLVALSTSAAGREFDLDKTAMVIGRTDDNDICINHRSISRHHAKIVRENGRYAIVDLQSSNGVRVNGEEYGKVELRRADVIDLGHVRLRFVEAGEDFVFGRDAQAMDLVPQGSPRVAMWVALVLLLIGAAVVLFLILGGGETEDGTGMAEAGGTTVSENDRPPSQPPVAPSVATAPGETTGQPAESNEPPPSDEVSKLLERARQAVDAEKWNDVLTAAKEAQSADPGNRAAQSFVDQAQSELANEAVYKQFTRAVGTSDYTRVAELFRKLDPESVYRVKAQQDHERLKQNFIRSRSLVGKRLADRGRCSQQERLAGEAAKVWTEAGRAVQNFPCKTPASAPPAGPPAGGPPPVEGAAPEGPGEAGVSGTFEELYAQAREAADSNQYAKSLRLCEAASDKRAGDQEAAMMCGISACRVKNVAKARKFLRRLASEEQQDGLRRICAQEQIVDL